jgi:hypothetical protein
MNDPGLDEPISNDAQDVENQVNDERGEKEEDEQAFLEPRQVFFLPETASVTSKRVPDIIELHLCHFYKLPRRSGH